MMARRSTAARHGAFIALALGLWISACGGEDILVADLPGADAGGLACASTAACPPGSFCSMAACGAAQGVCALEPLRNTCTGTEDAVCGCDKITYYNDCLRQAAGVRAATAGVCSFGADKPCKSTCEEGAICARVVPVDLAQVPAFICAGPAGPPASIATVWPGSCWVIPDSCPLGAPKNVQSYCPLGQPCVDTCTAIRTGGLYVSATACP